MFAQAVSRKSVVRKGSYLEIGYLRGSTQNLYQMHPGWFLRGYRYSGHGKKPLIMYWANFPLNYAISVSNETLFLFHKFFLGTNVALGKPATQTKDENYAGWTWSADYAVDGCKDRDSPDSQQCCSTSIPNYPKTENKWSVDLLGPYVIDRIIIFGRSGMICVPQKFDIRCFKILDNSPK